MESSSNHTNLYHALGVSQDATPKEIDAAYKKLALKFHPDKTGGGSDEAFRKIQEAREILGDPKRRERYDLQCRAWGLMGTAHSHPPSDFSTSTDWDHDTYEAYIYTHGHSVHMDPDSPESMEEKARHAKDMEDWINEWDGIDPEVEKARTAMEGVRLDARSSPYENSMQGEENVRMDSDPDEMSLEAHIKPLGKVVQDLFDAPSAVTMGGLLQVLQPFVAAKLKYGKGKYSERDLVNEVQGGIYDVTPLSPAACLPSTDQLCPHSGFWEKRFGQPECGRCHLWMPAYNQTCSTCGLEACVSCRASLFSPQ